MTPDAPLYWAIASAFMVVLNMVSIYCNTDRMAPLAASISGALWFLGMADGFLSVWLLSKEAHVAFCLTIGLLILPFVAGYVSLLFTRDKPHFHWIDIGIVAPIILVVVLAATCPLLFLLLLMIGTICATIAQTLFLLTGI